MDWEMRDMVFQLCIVIHRHNDMIMSLSNEQNKTVFNEFRIIVDLLLTIHVTVNWPIQNSKVEYCTPLPESFKALSLSKEIDDACLDLTLDFKADGRPKLVNMRLMYAPDPREKCFFNNVKYRQGNMNMSWWQGIV